MVSTGHLPGRGVTFPGQVQRGRDEPVRRCGRFLVFVAVTKVALIKSYRFPLSVPAKSIINSVLYIPFCQNTGVSWLLGRLCCVPAASSAPMGCPRVGLCDGRGKGMDDASEEDCSAAVFLPQQRDFSVFSLHAFSKTLSFK